MFSWTSIRGIFLFNFIQLLIHILLESLNSLTMFLTVLLNSVLLDSSVLFPMGNITIRLMIFLRPILSCLPYWLFFHAGTWTSGDRLLVICLTRVSSPPLLNGSLVLFFYVILSWLVSDQGRKCLNLCILDMGYWCVSGEAGMVPIKRL